MIRNSFNDNWTVGPRKNFFQEMVPSMQQPKKITLPHDAMVENERMTEGGNSSIGCYPDGTYEYKKRFFVPLEYREKRVTIEFEGVYNHAVVYINGDFACQHPYGYSNFYVKADAFLKYGADNEIKVIAHTNKDSRWYSGAGIYRNTKLIVGNLVHIALDGVKVSTPDISEERAVASVATLIENDGISTVTVQVLTEILDTNGRIIAQDEAPITVCAGETETVRQRLYVKAPSLWSVDHPSLYTCRTTVKAGDEKLDEETTKFGIRSLTIDPQNGLCINGESIKLRGACIHHDNGVIGAATIERAEERRVEILKDAGFNALRSAHHPMGKALLDACDRLGMLVMDESFDVWTTPKSDFDYSFDFPIWWEKDIQLMVDKDFNHPSVIMYSIGNEIAETGSPAGAKWGRKMAEKIHSLDPHRLVTNSIQFTIATMEEFLKSLSSVDPETEKTSGVNTMMNWFEDQITAWMNSESASSRTAESFACLDVAGYNYADSRYEKDKALFPNRVIVGTESFPNRIDKIWASVKENNHVIGDFTWTGWDYLGEAGVGRTEYEVEELGESQALYPWLTGWCGDIDIIGNRRPISYYREIVFGLRKAPYIAVHRPEHYGKKAKSTSWSWSDSISSWTWNGLEGKLVRVEVYADADEVELVLNGKSLGKNDAGEANRFMAMFDTVYEPGELVAIAYINGNEIGRMALHSADGDVLLKVEPDRKDINASENDLSFVMISLVDKNGTLYNTADRKVTVEIDGAGVLQGFGSGCPTPEENFFDSERTTFDGKVLAVVRPTGVGIITVTVQAEGCSSETVTIHAK